MHRGANYSLSDATLGMLCSSGCPWEHLSSCTNTEGCVSLVQEHGPACETSQPAPCHTSNFNALSWQQGLALDCFRCMQTW